MYKLYQSVWYYLLTIQIISNHLFTILYLMYFISYFHLAQYMY